MKTAKQENSQLRSADVSCHAPGAQSVFLSGTFNDWDSSAFPMQEAADGTWCATLQLAPGTYEYKFLVDGEWVCKPGVGEFDLALLGDADCVPNVYGTANRRLEIV